MADKRWQGNDQGIWTYESAVKYILDIPKFAKTKTSPAVLTELLHCLDNPQEKFPVLHVAGTNGKGSVCAFLTNILIAGGKRTGTFTSPHLEVINERFQINGQPISNQLFLDAFQAVYKVTGQKVRPDGQGPTFFEFLFLMAMWIFRAENVEYGILETGLGGRLDATNVISKPLAAIITSIGLDHTKILGNTIAEIAGEKAGIIKSGVPVIYDGNHDEAAAVIENRSQQLLAPAIPATNQDIISAWRENDGWTFLADYKNDLAVDFQIPFIPRYQLMNARLAIRAIEVIDRENQFSLDIVRAGLLNTRWPGRMERIAEGIYLDGAHNPPAMEQFIECANDISRTSDGKVYLLFSVLQEKDYQQMIQLLATTMKFDQIFLLSLESERGLPAKVMADSFRQYGGWPLVLCENIGDAWNGLLKIKSGNDKVFCVGSLYMAGEIKALLRRKHHD